MSDIIKKKIVIESEAKGLQDIYNQLKKISDSSNIKMNVKNQKEFEIKLSQFLKQFEGIKEMDVNSAEFVEFQKQLGTLQKMLEKMNLEMASMAINPKLKEQFDELSNKIKKAKSDIKNTKGRIKTREGRLDDSGELIDTEANKIVNKTLKKKNIVDGSNNQISTYEQVVKELERIQGLSEEQRKGLSEEFNLLKSIVEACKKRAEEARGAIDAEKETLKTQEEQLANLSKDRQALVQENNSLTDQADHIKQTTTALEDNRIALSKQQMALDNQEEEVRENNKQYEIYRKQQEKASNTQRATVDTINKASESQKRNTSILARATKQVITYGSVVGLLKKVYQITKDTIKDMDKALTDMAVVTNMSREQTWQLVGEFQNLAKQTGKTSSEIASMATKFYQQGKSTTQVLQLTEAAAKAATIAGISGSQSIDLLTNAMNGFQLSASQAMVVSDKFAALAASAATNYEELATALSKVAAQANLAGMSMDFTLGLLTKGIEVTREAPETIGTALKTVIARMRELTDYGATLEDGMDVNRVAKALSNIGVELMDEQGQFRDLEEVITEVGMKWETLNKNQQANVAVAMAGTRQQSRLIAMMQDFDRTLELVDVSANSYGATMAQQSKYMGGLEASTTLLTNSWQTLITTLTNSDVFIKVLDTLTGIFDAITLTVQETDALKFSLGALGLALALVAARKLALNVIDEQSNILRAKSIVYTIKSQLSIDKENTSTKASALSSAKATLQRYKEIASKIEDTKWTNENTIAEIKNKLETEKLTEVEKERLTNQIKEIEASNTNLDIAKDLMKQKIKDAETNVLKAQSEYDMAKATELSTQKDLAQAQALEKLNWLSLAGAIAKIALAAATKINEKAIKQETKAIDKNTASVNANKSAWLTHPIFIIAAIIIAVIAAIAALIIITIKQTKKQKEANEVLKRACEELNKLQAELYNLRNTKGTVSSLADEFTELSNKIIKSNEDLARMKEIINQINDLGGEIDENADIETQKVQIAAFQVAQNFEEKSRIQQLQETQDSIIKNTGIALRSEHSLEGLNEIFTGYFGDDYILDPRGDYWHVTNSEWNRTKETAEISARAKYADTSAGSATIRTLGEYETRDLAIRTEKNKDIIIDLYEGIWAELPLVADSFEDFLDLDEKEMDSFKNSLDTLATSDSLSKIQNTFKNLPEHIREALKESNALFDTISQAGDKINVLDEMDLSRDEINQIFNSIPKEMQASFNEAINKGTIKSREQLFDTLVGLEKAYYGERNESIQKGIRGQIEAIKKELSKEYKTAKDFTDNGTRQDFLEKYYDKETGRYNVTKELLEENGFGEKEIKNILNYNKGIDEKLGEIELLKSRIKDLEEGKNKTNYTDEYFSILGGKTLQQITDDITKYESASERLAKATDFSSLSIKEQQELLTDYPQLYGAVARGYITAAEKAKVLEKAWSDLREESTKSFNNQLRAMKQNYGLKGLDKLDITKEATLADLRDAVASGVDDDSWWSDFGIEDSDLASAFLADAQELLNFFAAYEKTGKTWADTTELKNIYKTRYKVQADALNKELELYEEGTEEYQEALEKWQKAATQAALQAEANAEDSYKKIEKYFSDVDWGEDEKTWEDYIQIVDGQVLLTEDYNDLSKNLKDIISAALPDIKEYAKEYGGFLDEAEEGWRQIAQTQIDAQIAALEKQKEAYEKYFEEIDASEEEEEFESTRESLVKQISALEGAVDGNSKAKLKELQQQLEANIEEARQAQKENLRNAALEGIDNGIAQLNESLPELIKTLKADAEINNPSTPNSPPSTIKEINENGTVNNINITIGDGQKVYPTGNIGGQIMKVMHDNGLVSNAKI